MRLGGPAFVKSSDPVQWAQAHRAMGYGAAYGPILELAQGDLIEAYARAAADADLVIAEVGAWSNPLSPDEATAKKALQLNKDRLALADRLAARCCVNITGSRGRTWDGPHASNFTDDTFDLIVQTVRDIIDSVKPTRTFYTLETMPAMYPDSADCYVRLMKAIDRKQFAAHLDPVNLVCSPQRYHDTGALIRECFAKLGPHIRSCHGKDVLMSDKFIVHIDEVRPGLGHLDYKTFLRELSRLAPDTPLMLEHLNAPEEYALAAEHVRGVATEVGLSFR
jgi:sugar phosphate isomerase/epimerase